MQREHGDLREHPSPHLRDPRRPPPHLVQGEDGVQRQRGIQRARRRRAARRRSARLRPRPHGEDDVLEACPRGTGRRPVRPASPRRASCRRRRARPASHPRRAATARPRCARASARARRAAPKRGGPGLRSPGRPRGPRSSSSGTERPSGAQATPAAAEIAGADREVGRARRTPRLHRLPLDLERARLPAARPGPRTAARSTRRPPPPRARAWRRRTAPRRTRPAAAARGTRRRRGPAGR